MVRIAGQWREPEVLEHGRAWRRRAEVLDRDRVAFVADPLPPPERDGRRRHLCAPLKQQGCPQQGLAGTKQGQISKVGALCKLSPKAHGY